MQPKKYLIEEFNSYLETILGITPGRSGQFFRALYYRRRLLEMGPRTFLSPGCMIRGHQNICLGDDVGIGMNNHLLAGDHTREESIKIGHRTKTNANVIINADIGGQIIVGNDVLIGPNTVIRASNHNYRSRETIIFKQGHSAGKIVIGDDVWIAANVTLLPDVAIGQGAVVGAGAVINKDVAPYSVVGGVPAKKIGERN